MTPIIARADAPDAAALTEIAFTAKRHWGYRADWMHAWADALTITGEYIRQNPTFVAVVEGEQVGFCAVVLRGDEAVLDHLWVIPRAMRGGVGRQLFARAETAARAGGAKRIKVIGEPNAEGFYLRMGAVRVGREFAPVCGEERWLTIFEKRLDP